MMATTTRQLGDPTTIRNPHARPARSRQPQPVVLPEVIERPDDYAGVRFMLQRGEDPPGLDVIGGSVWELVYRCVYTDTVHDEIARYQRVIAADRAGAVRALQWLMYGFARSIVLYDARPLKTMHHPGTPGQG